MLKDIDFAVSGDGEYRKARADMVSEANRLEAEMRKLDEQRDAVVERIHEADMKQFEKDLKGKVLSTGSALCFNVFLRTMGTSPGGRETSRTRHTRSGASWTRRPRSG